MSGVRNRKALPLFCFFHFKCTLQRVQLQLLKAVTVQVGSCQSRVIDKIDSHLLKDTILPENLTLTQSACDVQHTASFTVYAPGPCSDRTRGDYSEQESLFFSLYRSQTVLPVHEWCMNFFVKTALIVFYIGHRELETNFLQ